MQNYDIIHLDDSDEERGCVERQAIRSQLTYLGVEHLNALEEALQSFSANVYVIDGKFPVSKGGVISFRAPEAFQLLRSRYQDATIILYSAEWGIDRIAHEHHVIGIDKGEFTAGKLVEQIKTIIEQQNKFIPPPQTPSQTIR